MSDCRVPVRSQTRKASSSLVALSILCTEFMLHYVAPLLCFICARLAVSGYFPAAYGAIWFVNAELHRFEQLICQKTACSSCINAVVVIHILSRWTLRTVQLKESQN